MQKESNIYETNLPLSFMLRSVSAVSGAFVSALLVFPPQLSHQQASHLKLLATDGVDV